MGSEIRVRNFHDGHTLREELSGREFETIITPLVEDAIAVAEGALRNAGMDRSGLTSILLAGGTSQIPCVQDSLEKRFECEVKIAAKDLMWLIAKGAAIHHRDFMKLPGEETQQMLGSDLFLETATYGRLEPTLLVPARQTLPHTCFREFSINAYTTDLTIQLLRQSGTDNQEMTSLTRREISMNGSRLSKIGVQVRIDINKTIKVSVVDPTTKLPLENVEIQGDILDTAEEIRILRERYGLSEVVSPPVGHDQRYAIGIDLGTTTCEAMVYDTQEKAFLRGVEEPLLSRVFVRKGGVPDFRKRDDIGNRGHSLENSNHFWNFKVDIGRDTGSTKYHQEGKQWPPEILSAYLLAVIWNDLQAKFGAKAALYQAVITVPSDFSPDQNALVEKAAKIAGIASPITLTEPVAAALAYNEEYQDIQKPNQNFLIFDFGGGTTDVCIIKTKPGGKIEELGRNGNNSIGGENLTTAIADALIDRFEAAHEANYDKLTRDQLRRTLKPEADKAKVAISQALAKGDE